MGGLETAPGGAGRLRGLEVGLLIQTQRGVRAASCEPRCLHNHCLGTECGARENWKRVGKARGGIMEQSNSNESDADGE